MYYEFQVVQILKCTVLPKRELLHKLTSVCRMKSTHSHPCLRGFLIKDAINLVPNFPTLISRQNAPLINFLPKRTTCLRSTKMSWAPHVHMQLQTAWTPHINKARNFMTLVVLLQLSVTCAETITGLKHSQTSFTDH